MKQIIFITGIQHSGTTILYRMLAKHEDLAWFSQYSLRDGSIKDRKRIPRILESSANKIGRQILNTPWTKQIGVKGLSPTPEESDIWDIWLPNNKAFYYPEDLNIVNTNFIADIVEKELNNWGLDRFLAKKPALSKAVLLLNEVFPKVKFINIQRDGKAVAISLQRKFSNTPYGQAKSLELAANYWKEVSEYLMACDKNLTNFLTLSYEDFCEDVHTFLLKILSFCELDPNKINLNKLPKHLSITNQKRFDTISINDKFLLNKILGKALSNQGYSIFPI